MKRARVIAELSSNHLGKLDLAKELCYTAKSCGADYAKFQSWQSIGLSPKWLKDIDYYKQCELTNDGHYELFDYCQSINLGFLTTCFSLDRIAFLKELSPSIIKIASIDATSTSLINACKDSFDHILVSTGMSKPDEIQWLAYLLQDKSHTLLHCVSEYPTPLESTRMARMLWLKQFSSSVGLSCHSQSIYPSMTAIANGAEYIEKHFIMEHNDLARDSKVSILPRQLKKLCEYRDACELMFEDDSVSPTDDELEIRARYTGKWGENR